MGAIDHCRLGHRSYLARASARARSDQVQGSQYALTAAPPDLPKGDKGRHHGSTAGRHLFSFDHRACAVSGQSPPARLGAFVGGGQYLRLPLGLRIGSAVSILIYAGFAAIVLRKAGLVAVTGDWLGLATWAIAALLAVGTVMNAISRSMPERLVMTPVAAPVRYGDHRRAGVVDHSHLSVVVSTGLVPVVHAWGRWIAGTSPAMTMEKVN